MSIFNMQNLKTYHPQLLVLLATTAYQQEFDFASELLVFFIRYLFLFEQFSNKNKSCDPKAPQFSAPQGNGEMGIRYLDPKYSRWISVDPALGEYVPQAPVNDDAKKHNQNLPGMGGVFNSVNLSLFHYAGNNPVRYVDPDGRITSEEQKRQEELFTYILSFVEGWNYYSIENQTKTGPRNYNLDVAKISEEGIKYIKNISKEACTAGAISLRNKYRDRKIPVTQYAFNLLNNFKDKTFYRYGDNDYRKHGQIITDRNLLFDIIQVGDILIYTNPDNPSGDPDIGWTGHTATIIDKGKDYVTTLEFHQYGLDPSIQKLSKDSLQNFDNTELYGGAKWE